MGYLKPRSGRIVYCGRDITTLRPYEIARLGVGYVPQERGILPSLTDLEHLSVFARNGHGGRWTLQRVYELFPALEARRANLGSFQAASSKRCQSHGRSCSIRASYCSTSHPRVSPH